jgi:hypothetical protein
MGKCRWKYSSTMEHMGSLKDWRRTEKSIEVKRLDWIDDGYVSWTLDISIDGVL